MADGGALEEEVVVDLRYLQFISPAGVVILSSTLEWIRVNGGTFSFRLPAAAPRIGNEAVRYLDDSGFFERYLGQKLSSFSRLRPTTVPLSLVSYELSYQWLQNRLIDWLSARLAMNRESLGILDLCFGEVFNNIRDHSGENVGCVAAQHFPRQSLVHIAVSDFGVGIPTRVREKLLDLGDSEAVLKAIEPGFTTESTPRNRGAGLDTLASQVAQENGGQLVILSGHGVLSARQGPEQPAISAREAPVSYPGTLIDARLRTDTIEPLDPEDLLW